MDNKMEDEVAGLDEGEEEVQLKVVSQEGEEFIVPKKVAMMSELIRTMLDGDKNETDIPLPNVKTSVLEKVVQYMTYHCDHPPKEIQKPLQSARLRDVVEEWDDDFVGVSQDLLFELILAANYMDIKPLLDLTCAKVASLIKGKDAEQIRKTFHIQNDFAPEEEEAILSENKWASDFSSN